MPRLAFGSSQKRFGKVALHPRLNIIGDSIERPIGCNPCYYHPKDLNEIYPITRKESKKEPWSNKKELEEWSKNLGYRNEQLLHERQQYRTNLGPVWYAIRTPSKYTAACQNVLFGRTPRFKPPRVDVPGPTTYCRDHPYKAPYGPHSQRQTFDREDFCRFKDTSSKWSLAPNRYTITDKDNIEEKPKKIVSLRGPYNLFTGMRDGTTIKNHFNTTNRVTAASWPYFLGSTLDRYKNSHFGIMNKTGRALPNRSRLARCKTQFCYKDPNAPGPDRHNIRKEITFKQNMYGFNSSYSKPPCYRRVIVWPAVARYKIKDVRRIPGKGHKHLFRSKIQRTPGYILPKPLESF